MMNGTILVEEGGKIVEIEVDKISASGKYIHVRPVGPGKHSIEGWVETETLKVLDLVEGDNELKQFVWDRMQESTTHKQIGNLVRELKDKKKEEVELDSAPKPEEMTEVE